MELTRWFANVASARANARPTQQAPDSLYTGSTRQQLSVCVPVGILALVKLPSVHQAAFTCSVASVSPSACFTLL